MQSAALRLYLCLGFCRSLGNLDPCDARVGCGLAVTSIVVPVLGLFTGRVGGSRGGYRRSILIVDRLYYRIIRLGLLFLSLSLSLRCFAFLFLSLLLL
jgi:hypothetical protein